MNSNFTTGMNKASKFTAENYGTKISVEIDHSDLTLDEVMDAFETLIIGMGYHADSLKNWIIDRADEHRETDNEKLKEQLEDWKFEDDDNDFFGQMDSDEKRMDIIGQNGNEGLHYDTDMGEDYEGQFEEWNNETPTDSYRATDEDEDEFSHDGGFDGRPHFEWGDEPEDDGDLFEGDSWVANEKLVEANERYKSEVKKMNSKKKNNKK
jgi:hypothetical protein